MPRRPAVDPRSPLRRVLRDVRRHARCPHRAHEGRRVVALVGTEGTRPKAAVLGATEYVQRLLSLGTAFRRCDRHVDAEPVAVLHHYVPRVGAKTGGHYASREEIAGADLLPGQRRVLWSSGANRHRSFGGQASLRVSRLGGQATSKNLARRATAN